MQPLAELRVHPVDLSEFGTTPFGESTYRVVWSDSRKSVAFRGDRKIVSDKYQHGAEAELRDKWVLEKWLPAALYYGMTAEQWEDLQKIAPQKKVYSQEHQRIINAYLDGLSSEMRTYAEAQLTVQEVVPIVEPYSAQGDYEFAGIYFKSHVDEAILKDQVRAHLYRMAHTTDEDRKVEAERAETQKEIAADEKFDTLFETALDEAKA